MKMPDARPFGIEQCRQSLTSREELAEWLMEQRESINRRVRFRCRPVAQHLRWGYGDFHASDGLPIHFQDSDDLSDSPPQPWTENPRHKFTRFLNTLAQRLRDGRIRSKEEMEAFILCFDGMDELPGLEPQVLEALRAKRLDQFIGGLLPPARKILMKKSDPDYESILQSLEFFPRFREMLFMDTIDKRSTVAIYRKLVRKILLG